jgi:plastocyanin
LRALRRAAPLAAVVCAAFPAAASAADFNVNTTSSFRFSPTPLTIAPGDTVVFHNADSGFHNVHFDDGQLVSPSSPSPTWPARVARTFSSAGRFTYHCDQHESLGMKGVVVVGTPSLSPPPSVDALKLARARGGALKVRLRASAASTARITLARRSKGRFRRVRSLRRSVGTSSKTFTFRRLKAGRYRVTVQLTANGNAGPKKSRSITLS